MSFLGAYFDESGSESDTPIVTVAGLIASSQQWDRFNRDWDRVLQSEKNVKYLHMKEFAHFRGQFGDREYWKEERRRTFLGRLIEVVREHTRCYLVSTLEISPFKSVKAEFKDVKLSAYQYCCEQCMAGLSNYMLASPKRKGVDVIFEQGNSQMSEGMQLYFQIPKSNWLSEKWKIKSIVQGNRVDHKPLQAADLLAYELFKNHKTVMNNPMDKPRQSVVSLVKGQNAIGYLNDKPELVRRHFKIILANRQLQTSLRSSFLKPCP